MSSTADQQVVSDFFVVAERMRRRFLAVTAELGLTEAQMRLLEVLQEGQLPMRSAAERLDCDPSNVTGIVDRLEARDIVDRRRSDIDRRVIELALTDNGIRLLAEHHQLLYAEVPLFTGLGPFERQELGGLLRKVVTSGA